MGNTSELATYDSGILGAMQQATLLACGLGVV